MTAECLSIKKKELIKTIRTNYFNQSEKEREKESAKERTKSRRNERIMVALETVAPRKLSLSEPNVFRGCDDKKTRENEKKIGVAAIKQRSLCVTITNSLC